MKPWRIIPMALAACGLSGTAAAKAQIATGAGGNYRVAIMSWAEIPFRSVVAQQFDFSCGSAAVATLLTYHYGRPTPERPVFAAMWAAGDQAAIRRSGFSMLDIKQYLDGIGLRTEGYRLSIEQLARLDRPGIIILDFNGYRHFVVVKGIARGQVLIGDPMRGLSRYPLAEVAARWNGVLLTVVAVPGREARFNVPGEWLPWASAPLDRVAIGAPAADLTRALPSLYQITPSILTAARP
ncbi:MAG: C39 family peptidase [Novosphingobium sp.]